MTLTCCIGEHYPQEKDNETSPYYLSVNMLSATTTRAVSDGDGTDEENKINSIRFYFFDEQGDMVNVWGRNNYIDWIPDRQNSDGGNSDLTALLTVIIESGKQPPTRMMAIANPPAELISAGNRSAADLSAITADYAELANAATPLFVLSNSVFANTAKQVVSAVSLSESNFSITTAGAYASPVRLALDRTVAKVSVSAGINGVIPNADGTFIAPARHADGTPVTIDGYSVYVNALGWSVVNDADRTRLIKDINPTWTDDELGFIWNQSNLCRSLWAKTPTEATNKTETWSGLGQATFIGNNYRYCNENTSGSGNLDASTLVVKARLCRRDGTPIEVAAFHGARIVGENNLKSLMLSMLQANSSFFKVTDGIYRQIEASDIEFKTASDITPGSSLPSYYVYARLTDVARTATWSSSTAARVPVSASSVDAALMALGHAMIWKNGMTYFHYTIKHLATDEAKPGHIGVVRNHHYNFTVVNIIGLGTPVYHPDENIIPESPPEEDSFLGVKVNILPWHLVAGQLPFN